MNFELPEINPVARLIILAVVQGVAEFLPVSSSGHLNVGAELLGGKPNHRVNIALHFGTLLSILAFYHRRIISLLGSDRRVIPLLLIGTVPAAAFGLAVKFLWPWLEENLLLTGMMFCVTGVGLCWFQRLGSDQPEDERQDAVTEKAQSPDETGEADRLEVVEIEARPKSAAGNPRLDYVELTVVQALLIGCFQAIAILPGISRSGSTILAGCLVGLRHNSAATFSFLLAIPAILGATVLEVFDVIQGGGDTEYSLLLLGLSMLVAFGVGLLSLVLLVSLLNRGKLHWFAMWVLPLGMIVIVWQLYEQLAAAV